MSKSSNHFNICAHQLERQLIRDYYVEVCPSGRLCTCPYKDVRSGYQGVLRDKTSAYREQRPGTNPTMVSKREKQVQSGISLDKKWA